MIKYDILTEKDILSLLGLYRQLNPTDDTISEMTGKNIWKEIERQDIKYFVAKDNGKIISACYICIIPNLTRNGKSIGFIENVVTDTAYRRMGIGKTVVQNAIAYAKEQNCYKVLLQCGNKRAEVHRFYEEVGFDGQSKRAFEIRF